MRKNRNATLFIAIMSLFISLSFAYNLFIYSSNKEKIEQVNNIEVQLNDAQVKLKFYEASRQFDKRNYQFVIESLEPVVIQKSNIFNYSPTFSYAYLLLGISYEKVTKPLTDNKKALLYLNTYLEQNSHIKFRNFVRENLADIYKDQNQKEDAEKILLDGLKENPDNILYRNLGFFYLNEEKYLKAIQYYNEGIKLNPDDYLSYLQISFAYIAKKRCSEATVSIQMAQDSYLKSKSKSEEFDNTLDNAKTLFKYNCGKN